MIKRIPLFNYTVSALVLMLCICNAAHSEEALSPRAEVNFRAGTDRSILMTEFWAPLAQQSDRVLYGDLRLMGDEDDNREGNLGFGYRQISTKTNSVLGANAWIDRRRTENGNNFHQLTLGVESLSDIIDLRANGYIQLNNSKTRTTPNIGSATPYLAGTGMFFDTNGFIIEEPQDGFDAEVGYRLPILQRYIDATRFYAGGYHFFGDTTDDTTGFRLRAEAQVNSIFSVGARFQHDGPRGSQGFLEATLRFPFKSKRLYQEHGLRSRLDESPERDIDIVTGAKVIDTGLMKPVINTATGAQQRILYVDNTNSNAGDGSKDNPFNTLAAAQSALQDNDILYVNRGDGTTTGMDQGISISQNNVQLIGSGSALTYGGFTLLDAGDAPIITNTITPANSSDIYTGNGVLITGDNPFVSGLTVSNSAHRGVSIYVDSKDTSFVKVHNVTSISNSSIGFLVQATNNSTIESIEMIGNSSVTNQPIVSSANGMVVYALSGSSVGSILLENNTVSGNSNSGLSVSATNGQIGDIMARNNTVRNNSVGLFIISNTDSLINSVSIENNISYNNTSHGIQVNTAGNGQIGSLLIDGNNSYGNGGSGFFMQLQAGRINTATVRNNIAAQNTTVGIAIGVQSNSELASSFIENNISINNRQDGLQINTIASASITSKIGGNTLTGNGHGSTASVKYYGLLLNYDSTSTFDVDVGSAAAGTGQNRIYNNFYQDLFLDSMSGSISLTINAQNNWWGNNADLAVGRRTLDGTSTINTTGFLTTDPSL